MPRFQNPNNHPVVVSITEPRISVTVFPITWAKNRLPAGARQEIELDEVLARVFLRTGMLQRVVEPTSAAPATAPTPPPAPPTEPSGFTASTEDGPDEVVLPPGAEAAPESKLAVTEEAITPSDLAMQAQTESQRLAVRSRPPSPPRRKRYAL